MDNANMKAGRFHRWHIARRKVAAILAALDAGHTVALTTYTRSVRYTAKHRDMFRAATTGAYV